jgi:hypothetical protein
MGAVVLALLGIGGVTFGIRAGGLFDLALGACLLFCAYRCGMKAAGRPSRPRVSGHPGHSRNVWE